MFQYTTDDKSLLDWFAVMAPPVPDWYRTRESEENRMIEWPYYWASRQIQIKQLNSAQ